MFRGLSIQFLYIFVRFGHVYSNVKLNHLSTDLDQTLRSCFGQTEPTTDKLDIVARNHLSGCSNQDIWRESAPATIAGSRCIKYDNSEYFLGKCEYLAVLWDLTILAEVSLCGVFSSQRGVWQSILLCSAFAASFSFAQSCVGPKALYRFDDEPLLYPAMGHDGRALCKQQPADAFVL